MTQPGNFSLVGEGLNVGKDPGEPVTDDYPGEGPYAFTGGTIKEAIVDVSGEPFIDLEKEAIAIMARDDPVLLSREPAGYTRSAPGARLDPERAAESGGPVREVRQPRSRSPPSRGRSPPRRPRRRTSCDRCPRSAGS